MSKTPTPDEEAKTRTLQRNLVRFRGELGKDVTQQDVADMAGVSVFSVSRYEGGGKPNADALFKLAEVFGRDPRDFYNPNPPPSDPSRRRRFKVRYKIIGDEPDGLSDAIEEVLRRFTPEAAAEQSERKAKMLRGKPQPRSRRKG